VAGYVIAVDKRASLSELAGSGLYGTILSNPRGYWGVHHEGTFADFASMRDGDRMYFFLDRVIYGIGRIVNVGPSCKYQNFPGATARPVEIPAPSGSLIDAPGGSLRWVVAFRPDPYIFTAGVDMDDALTYRPGSFRMLRSFWGRSFIKVDDEEDGSLADLILRANRGVVDARGRMGVFADQHAAHHAQLFRRLTPDYRFDSRDLVRLVLNGSLVRLEMALEAALAFQMSERDRPTTAAFGAWDYITHQLVASPAKPPPYNDWIDVFGSSLISGSTTVGLYHVAELKVGVGTEADVAQVMKYVDWVKDEYAFGDYALVRGYLVAHSFDPTATAALHGIGRRLFTKGRRPPRTEAWGAEGELSLIRYEAEADGYVRFIR
jgi:hypothetical protein